MKWYFFSTKKFTFTFWRIEFAELKYVVDLSSKKKKYMDIMQKNAKICGVRREKCDNAEICRIMREKCGPHNFLEPTQKYEVEFCRNSGKYAQIMRENAEMRGNAMREKKNLMQGEIIPHPP